MPTVSEQLRHAREAQKLDVYQVAEITKIKTDHIRALEEGNFDAFSAPVYIRGFVRTYATMLKLDVARVVAELHDELGRTENFSEPPPLTNRPRSPIDWLMLQFSRLNWRLALAGLVMLLLLGLAAAIWRNRTYQPEDPLKNLGPGLYQAPPETTAETLPLPTNMPGRPASR
jgi:cytoskeletal protein RodZ